MAALCAGAIAPQASAQEAWVPTSKTLIWNSDKSLADLDCAKTGNDGIVIRGKVLLRHPGDTGAAIAPVINVVCDNLKFDADAVLQTHASLRLKAIKAVHGNAVIMNVRGQAGADAAPRPDLWSIRKARSGKPGDSGKSGDNAETHLNETGAKDASAEAGDHGRGGEHGDHGQNGGLGENGRAGAGSGNLRLVAGTFAQASTLLMSARGGSGGVGGKGGRGEDGGIGGKGGNGGKGGDGNALHPGKTGGNGGNGGDGGNGGNGGRGGDGGDGGAGGLIYVYILEGGRNPEMDLLIEGGRGGQPGAGGDPGLGGDGGRGGIAGCGGKAGKFIIRTNSSGGCGTDGVDGKRGEDGKMGPPGVWGKDGPSGKTGDWHFGYVKPEDF